MPLRPFPMNAWYAAAWDVEVKRTLFARTVANQKIVLYRTLDGKPVALEDACWHRLLPLSMGRLEGDELVCGYHGLAYNAQGRCVYMPSQDTINPSACVRSYPVVERYRYVWVWPGDPALADPALVPDLHWNDDPDVGRGRQDDPRELRLPARPRQPDGSDARDVRPRLVDRQPRSRRSAVRWSRTATGRRR